VTSAASARVAAASPLDDQPASRLLLGLLRDYWYGSEAFVPSWALMALLGEFGINEPAGRAALSRLARRGWLQGRRDGRRTAYRVAPDRMPAALAAAQAVVAFGAEPAPWDGEWTCVAFSIPEAARRRRPALRRRLRALRLGPLFDGLWITPRAPLAAIDRSLAELGIGDAAVFRAREVPRPGAAELLGAWDLDALRAGYDGLVALLDRLVALVDRGAVPECDALVTRTDVMARWSALVAIDPGLPVELLPADWPLAAARSLVIEAYDALGPAAEARALALVGGVDSGVVPRSHRAADRLRDTIGGREDDHA
jgi:phenylacetic acid degradation operon negative regulatory protein